MRLRYSAMLRSFTGCLAVFAIVILIACWNKSGIASRATATKASTASTGGSEIYVEFRGTESWVFPTDTATPDRLVMIKGTAMHEHVPQIVLPVDVTATTTDVAADLKEIFGAKAVDCTTPRACVVDLEAPVALRLVDTDGNPPAPSTRPITMSARFKRLVPHLREVSKKHGSAEMADIDSELKSTSGTYPITATNAPFLAFFEIGGGTLDATVACGRAAYVATDTSVTNRTFEEFARSVVWTGTTPNPVKLQVNRNKGGTATGWQDVTFADSAFVHIYVLNAPKTAGISDHFELHKQIGSDKSIVLPTFNHAQDCEQIVKSDVIGCSNTQWP